MNKKLSTLSAFMLMSFLSSAQINESIKFQPKPKIYVVQMFNDKHFNFGYLASISDSSVQISSKPVPFSISKIENSYKSQPCSQIERLAIRRYGSLGRGIGFGALIGVGGGALIGLATYQKPKPGDWGAALFDFGPGFNALFGAVLGVIPGALVGGIIGSRKKKFLINRNKAEFDNMRATILEMATSSKRVKDTSVIRYAPPALN